MPSFSLRTLGGLALLANGTVVEGPSAQRKRLILLALVAGHNQGSGISRDRVLGLLWAESDEARARNALNQSLFALRRDLGGDSVTGSSELRIDATLLECDLVQFWRSVERRDAQAVVALYGGPFLDGVFVSNAEQLNEWIERVRSAVDVEFRESLQTLARQADIRHDTATAAVLWRRLAAVAPFDAAVASSLMRALAANGDRAGAVTHARVYGALISHEFGMEADASVASLASRLARESDGGADPVAPTVADSRAADAAIPPLPPPASVELDDIQADTRVSKDYASSARMGQRVLYPRTRAIPAAALVLLGLAVGAVRYAEQRSAAPSIMPRSIDPIVFPFQVDIADSSLTFLGEGIADLLSAALAQQGGAVPADAHSLTIAWNAASAGGGNRASIAARATERLGASRAILGTVVGTRARITVSAAIAERSGVMGAVAQAAGPPDSILAIVDRLASSLLAGQATQDAPSLADLTTRSPAALRQYLFALSAMRSGHRDTAVMAFRAALHDDSSFALAALGIATAGGWAEASIAERDKRDFRLGWQLRQKLAPRERSLFDAAVGSQDPTEDSDEANLDRWGRAARNAPDRPDVLYEYGDRLFHTGEYLGVRDADGLAERAFARAVSLDSSQVFALGHLVELALSRNDVPHAQDYYRLYVALDSLGDAAAYLAWRIALASGDSSAAGALRSRWSSVSSGSLRRIAGMSQLQGVAVGDAGRALALLVKRQQSEMERELTLYRLHALDLNIGQAAASARVLDQLAAASDRNAGNASISGDAFDLIVTDAIFSIGDTARARRTVTQLGQESRSGGAESLLRHACTTELWRVEHGDTSRTAATVRTLSSSRTRFDSATYYGWQPKICVTGLTAELALARHAGNAPDDVARMEALMATGPRGFGNTFGDLWVARLLVRIAEPSRALVAIARRRRDWDDVLYLADMDALALQLARQTGHAREQHVAVTRLRALRGNAAVAALATQ